MNNFISQPVPMVPEHAPIDDAPNAFVSVGVCYVQCCAFRRQSINYALLRTNSIIFVLHKVYQNYVIVVGGRVFIAAFEPF